MHVMIEAHIGSGGTFLKWWHVTKDDGNFQHVYLDTLDPTLVLNVLQNHMEEGRFHQIAKFIDNGGRVIRDPLEFRLKLDTALGQTSAFSPIGGDFNDLFDDE